MLKDYMIYKTSTKKDLCHPKTGFTPTPIPHTDCGATTSRIHTTSSRYEAPLGEIGVSSRSERGFTLVEIIIVVCIISLLAGVIFVSIKKVRIKSDNIVRLQQIEEYKNAVFMMVRDRGTTTGLETWRDEWCIGVYLPPSLPDHPDGKCSFWESSDWNTDVLLNNNIRAYIPSLPTLKPAIQSNNGKIWNGPMYGCGVYNASIGYWDIPPLGNPGEPPCTPVLEWAMQGNNQQCFPGATVYNNYPGITLCQIPVPYF